MDRAVARSGVRPVGRRDRDAWWRAHARWSGRWLLNRRCRAQERSRCTAGDRLFDRLGSLCNPPLGDLGSADDAGARGMAARVGVTAAAVLGSRARYSARTALTSPKVAFSAGIPPLYPVIASRP